jgi:16S rRNA (cytidine1402-2'-O)-methyltransferase
MTTPIRGLCVIATPIGNLRDITLRALDVLAEVDLVAAEDTRHTVHLLTAHGLRKPLVSLHEHNEAMRTAELIEKLADGTSIALLTDAGMPSVSDPGRRLVAACHERGIPVTVLPGPSAMTSAIAGAGFGGDAFCFRGFLPVKSGQRQREIEAALSLDMPTVFFESPHRLIRSLEVINNADPSRVICVCRELTKIHEEYRRDTAANLLAHYSKGQVRGEITLVISPAGRTGNRTTTDSALP